MEAELDFFGGHMFDLKSAEPGKPVTGKSVHNNLLVNILT
jgi:hypothetical protein